MVPPATPRRGQILVCTVCDIEYYAPPSKVETSLFCSRSCKMRDYHSKHPKTRTGQMITCKECGTPYYVNPARLTAPYGTAFCSKECLSKSQERPKVCSECGKSKPARLFKGETCSISCARRVQAKTRAEHPQFGSTEASWIQDFHQVSS